MGKRNNNLFYSPLRYPGGKNCIFPFVATLFYENNLLGMNYAEPYAGGAGLALRLLFEGYVDKVYINDLDKSIYSFWISILNRPDDFCSWLKDVDVTIENWRCYKEIQGNSESSLFDLAKSTFFLNRANISGVIKGGVIGGFQQVGKYKINARFNKDDLIKRIQRIASLKSRIEVSNLDGISFIKKLDKKEEDIFIYLDPPYYQKGADLYMNFYSDHDHRMLSKHVHGLNQRWMVSYDNHDFILKLYTKERKIGYKLSQAASNRVGDEILIFSNKVQFSSSIGKLNAPVVFK
jgi:DNA adenine methylase